jgi:hypothetical protein
VNGPRISPKNWGKFGGRRSRAILACCAPNSAADISALRMPAGMGGSDRSPCRARRELQFPLEGIGCIQRHRTGSCGGAARQVVDFR